MSGDLDLGGNDLLNPGVGHDSFTDYVATEHLDHAVSLDADMAAWWTMDNVSGTTVYDETGVNTATLVGDASQTTGILGKAVLLDGDGDYVEVDDGTDPSLDFGSSTDFTISMWINTTATSGATAVISHRSSVTTNIRWRLITSNGVLVVNFYDGSNVLTSAGTANIADGQWHHVFWTNDRDGNTTVYVDMVKDIEASMAALGSFDVDTFQIGGDNVVGFPSFNGKIDDVRIWRRLLSTDEGQQLYDMGALDSETSFDKAHFSETVTAKTALFGGLHITGNAFLNYLEVGTNINVGGDIIADTCTITTGNFDTLNADILNATDGDFSYVDIDSLYVNDDFALYGTFILKEAASSSSPSAGYGELWIKNNSPNELYFTNDAGTDIKISNIIGTDVQAWSATLDDLSGTSATAAQLDSLTDGSVISTLHRHSELVASDGSVDPALSVASNGYVGIGTSTPDRLLKLERDGHVGLVLECTGTSQHAEVILESKNASGGSHWWTFGVPYGRDSFIISPTGAELGDEFVFSSDGNLGIGVDVPTRRLSIHKSGHCGFELICEANSSHAEVILESKSSTGTPHWWTFGVPYSGDRFIISPSGVELGSHLVVLDGGNVGIGLTAPEAKLAVAGTLKLQERSSAVSDTAGWGQLWVKNTSPCELWFTDDAGNDHQIAFV